VPAASRAGGIITRSEVSKIGRITLALLAALAVQAAVCATAAAQGERSPYDEDVLRQARHVYNQIMSPFCPGQTLANCGSGAAETLRAQIRDRIAAGESPEDIIQSLIDEYGEDVMAEPPKSGFASLVWLGPIFLLLAGAAVIAVYVRRNTAAAPSGATHEVNADVRARVEEELKTHFD
jgi:cytochrome c-type biogenesis protein CcmH